MTKGSKPDAESPEWTEATFARSKRLHELPPDLQKLLKKGRGPQQGPTKELISIRLSQDVLAALRTMGRGWQRRVDETLRRAFVKERS
ncbi:MAG TPA: BrnA antitoxin family protein [Acidobacteriaceae bacterium]|nr:BrnA antitoxin family protein [Acidobacteriaceae bacterium]